MVIRDWSDFLFNFATKIQIGRYSVTAHWIWAHYKKFAAYECQNRSFWGNIWNSIQLQHNHATYWSTISTLRRKDLMRRIDHFALTWHVDLFGALSFVIGIVKEILLNSWLTELQKWARTFELDFWNFGQRRTFLNFLLNDCFLRHSKRSTTFLIEIVRERYLHHLIAELISFQKMQIFMIDNIFSWYCFPYLSLVELWKMVWN